MNPHCVIVVKHDFNKLFVARFIKLVNQTTRLSQIVVVL
jgi:diaminopimelate epimerase